MSNESSVAKGAAYEQFVQGIYQTVLKAEGFNTIVVEQNTTIRGNSGCDHQIDIYWEFKIAGQTYRTAIECKAYSTEVAIGRVRDFYGVLADVPNLNGIFATLIGYQSGAKRYATHFGIALKELRNPTVKDWEGRIKNINLTMQIEIPEIVSFQPRATEAFKNSLTEPLKIDTGFLSNAPIVFDNADKAVATYEDIRQKLPRVGAPFKGKAYFISFPDHVMKADNLVVPIEGFDIVYNVEVEALTSQILGEEMACAIIRDVHTGQYTFVDTNGNVRQPRDG